MLNYDISNENASESGPCHLIRSVLKIQYQLLDLHTVQNRTPRKKGSHLIPCTSLVNAVNLGFKLNI